MAILGAERRMIGVGALHVFRPCQQPSTRGPHGRPRWRKTTAADLFRRELGDRVVVVPEAATLLFSGGFPRSSEPRAVCSAQTAIFHVQRNLEDVQSALFPSDPPLRSRNDRRRRLLARRSDHFFGGPWATTLEAELGRYDAVIFFETAAAGGMAIEGGNPIRIESNEQAIKLDHRLRKLWSHHPRFVLVPHNPSFFKKITFGLASIESLVAQLAQLIRGEAVACPTRSSNGFERLCSLPSPCGEGLGVRVPSGPAERQMLDMTTQLTRRRRAVVPPALDGPIIQEGAHVPPARHDPRSYLAGSKVDHRQVVAHLVGPIAAVLPVAQTELSEIVVPPALGAPIIENGARKVFTRCNMNGSLARAEVDRR